MPKAAKKIPQETPANCPVVELAQKLLILWDADDGSQIEYEEKTLADSVKSDALSQFAEWREAIETMIYYTPPRDLQGALVQMALASHILREFDGLLDNNDLNSIRSGILRLDRLLESVNATVWSSLNTEIDPALLSILRIYRSDERPIWVDNVKGWAEKGGLSRVGE